ncbi:exocyst complex component Sec3-domain-containing protein [Zychaea mexicana]|uniref:exocyst complex component Sec3-domain-containing protein n=1 Tax=Zychaea mexicana TaxID=64656 RepID=UPI0022FEB837|nr:exocyst complex component Sec3-domain-containing protein [Zychaea mexicana]KAI9496495.1 exocyst complex component Sec3-domain-containing protein [Zychaea mexicana]
MHTYTYIIKGAAEKLLIHLKVFEDVKQTDPSAKNNGAKGPQIVGKPRYLCLTQKRNKIRLYKTKRNQNGAFTIGKSWSLDDIKQIEAIDPESDPRSYPSPPPNMSPERPKHSPLSQPAPTLPVASRPAPSPPAAPAPRTPQRAVEISPSTNIQPERRERERAREIKREREKREKQAQQEKEKMRKVAEMQEKMAEKASLMNVEELLADFNWKTSGNAAALEKRLLGELHALEAANVHAIIQSDERVRSVIDQIDAALHELDSMDSWLLLYSAELNSMGDDIREIESQNRGLQILAQNQHSLVRELDDLLNAITIPRSCLDSLKFDPMDTAENVEQIQSSAEKVQQVLKIKLGDGMQNMKAVQERMAVYNSHSNNFSARIFDFMKSQFDKQVKKKNQKAVSSRTPSNPRKPQQTLVAMPHTVIENNLIKYQGFSLWEKEMEPRMYSELQRYYAQTMAPLYEQDTRELIESVRPHYTTLRNRGLDELEYIFKPEESRPVRALAYGANLRSEDSRTNRYRQMLRGSVEGVIGGGAASIDGDERAADDAFAQLMAQGTMLVTREQNFMCDLFQYSQGAPKSFLERGHVYAQVPNTNELCGRREKPRDIKMSKKIIDWMEIIFETLEPSIVSLLEYGVKSDPTQTASMLASVEFQNDKWLGSDQDFLLRLCSSLMQRLTRMFERFVSDQLKIIEDTKVSTKKRRGILPFFRTFPLFALRLEVAAANVEPDSQTRQTVNDAYEKIINAMMSSLDSIARETDQTGDDKEQLNANIMYIENMHHFHHELRSNKLHVLEKWIKYAKSHYDTSLNAYIKVVIRRPLGKLLEFFEGVDNLMHTSTPEEVQFHMNYNKTQLRKVIAMYPAKEIKKSLEQLYKRVDKHFSEEEGLLQVVWRGIQEEFIQQHEKMENLIQKCYPDTRLHLEFSIDDLLSMMSELARKVHL